ncbi:MAG: GTP-binding protein [Candidatus Hodarchaeales archaeon]
MTGDVNNLGKTTISIVTLGHVDHGKSTAMGRFLVEMGVIDPRTLEKNIDEAASLGMEEWAYAYALDSLPEERERGLTSDIAFQAFKTNTKDIMLIDAPGHRDFVKNMIRGAAISDACILMVSVEPGDLRSGLKLPDGKTPGGQTREHAIIGSVLGIQQVIVCINKMDLIDYEESAFQTAVTTVKNLLKKIQSPWIKKDIYFIPISGKEGENLVTRSGKMGWYSGPCLLEAIDLLNDPVYQSDQDLRFLVQDNYDLPGTGSVLQGRVISGSMKKGDEVVLLPGAQVSKIRDLLTIDEKTVSALLPGNYGLVSLRGFSKDDLLPGTVLAPANSEYSSKNLLKVRLLVLESAPKPLIKGGQMVMHIAMGVTTVIIEEFLSLDRSSRKIPEGKDVFFTKPGEVATVLLSIDPSSQIVSEPYSKNHILGRVILRDMGNTVAVGLLI